MLKQTPPLEDLSAGCVRRFRPSPAASPRALPGGEAQVQWLSAAVPVLLLPGGSLSNHVQPGMGLVVDFHDVIRHADDFVVHAAELSYHLGGDGPIVPNLSDPRAKRRFNAGQVPHL